MIARRVLLTGAAGTVATALRPALRDRLDALVLSDVRPPADPVGSERVVLADLADAAAVDRAAEGVDAIVHLGGVADEAPFDALAAPNLAGAFHLFDAARRAGVRRVVYASSNRITGFAPVTDRLRGDEAPRPDGLYGATKAFGEALGHVFADRFGLEVVCVRIGSFAERPTEPRHLQTWLSPGDAVLLFVAALTAPVEGCVTVYGVSANTRSWWDPDPAARLLGYRPVDDAERFAAELGDDDHPRQGGRYTAPDYGDWAT